METLATQGLIQRHSRVVLIAHVVWSTEGREAVLAAAYDAWLGELLVRKGKEAGCRVLAVGNADDHVHVVARYPSTVTVAMLAQRLKGASSHAWNHRGKAGRLRWQTGSWVESVTPTALEPLLRYVADQRAHHASAALPEAWELAVSDDEA